MAQVNETYTFTIMKNTCSFYLSCFSIWSWWLFELVFVFPYAMYKCTCLKLKQMFGITKKIITLHLIFSMLRKVRKFV